MTDSTGKNYGNWSPEDLKVFFEGLGVRPCLSPYESVCYHGTTDAIARKIVREGKFVNSADGVIGFGVYFYEAGEAAGVADAGLEAALAWAKAVKCRGKDDLPNVVEAYIKTDKLFDTKNKTNRDFFNAVEDGLANRLRETHGEDSEQLRRLNDLRVAKFIAWECPDARMMEAIRARFEVPSFVISRHFGLVVREQKCICDIRLWTE
jgi:hypothetical protein